MRHDFRLNNLRSWILFAVMTFDKVRAKKFTEIDHEFLIFFVAFCLRYPREMSIHLNLTSILLDSKVNLQKSIDRENSFLIIING